MYKVCYRLIILCTCTVTYSQLFLSIHKKLRDDDTAELMTLFHRHLLGGSTMLQALRAAQQEMRASHPPGVWGALILVGDPSAKLVWPDVVQKEFC